MTIPIKQNFAIYCVAWLSIFPVIGFAQDAPQATLLPPAADMDLSVKYLNRELTKDGVLHTSSYEEKMIRRKEHVWTQRVLPGHSKHDAVHPGHEHKDFDYIVLARHVSYDGNKTTVEFVDTHERQVVYIAPTEYENVNFDGSWANAYYLVNPHYIALMPVSSRPSAVAHAQWHETNKNGMFQRVLWDKKLSIPLIIETGDESGNFLQRVEVRRSATLEKNLPWKNLQGYAQKEYSDFLD